MRCRHRLVWALALLPSARGAAARRHALPEWQALPGTRFIVDRFGRAAEASGCRSWFLTHFHADHYRGLTARFKAGAGAQDMRFSNYLSCSLTPTAAVSLHATLVHALDLLHSCRIWINLFERRHAWLTR